MILSMVVTSVFFVGVEQPKAPLAFEMIAERSEANPGVVCEGGLDAPTKHDQM